MSGTTRASRYRREIVEARIDWGSAWRIGFACVLLQALFGLGIWILITVLMVMGLAIGGAA